MPQTVSVSGGPEAAWEPRAGDIVVSHCGTSTYMVAEEFGGGMKWANLSKGSLHGPGLMSHTAPSGGPFWRILPQGMRVVLET